MQLSVIILNYNVRYFLELCITSVQKAIQNIDAEIIVVDNNSSDESSQMMKTMFPNIKFIQNSENTGFPKGNNIGVAEAKGDYICILNPDTVVAEDTFEKVLFFAKKHNNLGIIGCKLVDGTGNFLPECKRGIPTPWVALTKVLGLYIVFPKLSIFNKYYYQQLHKNETGKVEILVGAFMVMKRDLYNEIGGFDEDCFMYSDDIDLSYISLLNGKYNYYFHQTTVIHYKGESTVKDGVYMKRFQDAMKYFYKKHFNHSLFFLFFMKIGTLSFSLLKVFQGKPKPRIVPTNYILISDKDALAQKLKNKLNKEVEKTLLNNETLELISNIQNKKNTEVIFDTNYISYKDIIAFMENNVDHKYTYKMYLPENNFLIGSNSSNDRGETILLV